MSEKVLEDLVGEHELSGVAFDVPVAPELRGFDDSECCTFVLDGIAYQAVEDPDDGYRSSLGHLLTTDASLVANRFDPIKVVGSERSDTAVVEFRDLRNGKIILTIGTENDSDYYPWFEATWTPENIALTLSKTEKAE